MISARAKYVRTRNEEHRMKKQHYANSAANRGHWKIGVFIACLLVAVGAVVYSVAVRPAATAATTPAKTVAQAGTPASVPFVPKTADKATVDPSWVKTMPDRFVGHNLVLIVMTKAGDIDTDQQIEATVASAIKTIETTGQKVDTLTLKPGDSDYSLTQKYLSITQLPSVAIFNNAGQGATAEGEITDTKILSAYLTITRAACAPGAPSGCCPTPTPSN
jgi:hypothetical protein